jgi:methoxymalonate biosynthesis protein
MTAADNPNRLIKCVVWDLDNTLWPGVAVEESPEVVPEPDPAMLAVIDKLESRGIVSSVASRNDPSMLGMLKQHPQLGERIVAPQISWEPKSQAVQRIARTLNFGLDAVAFVDDSPFERAEVSYMLPQVLVLSPEELEMALASTAFNPAQATREGTRRVNMYREEAHRREAEAGFAGNRSDFLRWCDMRLQIALAIESDLERLLEMTERTHQLNSTGRAYTAEELWERIEGKRWLVPVARLTDRFGDYGLIGAALVDRQSPDDETTWLIELVMLSCRVEGRGIPAAMLRWIMGEAKAAGMAALLAVYRVNKQNLPMRLLFRQMGFQTVKNGDPVLVSRDLGAALPDYPEWLKIESGTGARR